MEYCRCIHEFCWDHIPAGMIFVLTKPLTRKSRLGHVATILLKQACREYRTALPVMSASWDGEHPVAHL